MLRLPVFCVVKPTYSSNRLVFMPKRFRLIADTDLESIPQSPARALGTLHGNLASGTLEGEDLVGEVECEQ